MRLRKRRRPAQPQCSRDSRLDNVRSQIAQRQAGQFRANQFSSVRGQRQRERRERVRHCGQASAGPCILRGHRRREHGLRERGPGLDQEWLRLWASEGREGQRDGRDSVM